MNIKEQYYNAVQKHSKNADAFFKALEAMAKRLGIPAEWIADVMWIESAFRPFIKNSQSTASGLIQMLESNTRAFAGVSAQVYRNLTNVQQLPSIEKYFVAQMKSAGKPKDWFDTYLLVFYPAWVKKVDSATLDPRSYASNKYIDLDSNGIITKAEFRAWATKKLPGGEASTVKKPDCSPLS